MIVIIVFTALNLSIEGNIINYNDEKHQIISKNSFIVSKSGYNEWVDEYSCEGLTIHVYTNSNLLEKRVVIFQNGQAYSKYSEVRISKLQLK